MKTSFQYIEYFSSTCDFWSRNNKKYLAVNVHFINVSTNKIETRLIACERLTGVINNEVVAQKLLEIFDRFGILEKIVAVTTDNGGEFIAAFRNFGDDYCSYEAYLDERNEFDNIDENDDDEVCDNVDIIPINERVVADGNVLIESRDEWDLMKLSIDGPSIGNASSLDNHDADCNNINLHQLDGLQSSLLDNFESDPDLANTNTAYLPIRIACAAHTLNLVGKTDSFNALLDNDYAEMYFDVIKKLNAIWKFSTNSRKRVELVEKILKRRIVKPHRIRWNRIHDAVSQMNLICFYPF